MSSSPGGYLGGWAVGRDSLLQDARHALTGSGVLLEGPAGIGKTAVWQRLRADSAQGGFLVLSAAPAESERLLPYAALADLLRPLAGEIRQLPAPQRMAAEVVLVSAEATGAFDERVVGAATRTLLEAALAGADSRSVLIAVDDAQWLDPPSERAIRFALRRLSRRPALMIAVRSETADPVDLPLGLDLLEPPIRRLVLSPLGVGALHHVLRARLGISLPRPLLARITRDSAGNP